MDDCVPECHRIERLWFRLEVERALRLILDGDPTRIEAILEVLDQMPEAA